MNRIKIGVRGAFLAFCLAAVSALLAPPCRAADVDQGASQAPAATRHYLIGVYAGPTDNSTPALMGYRWDFTIGRSYQDNCAGCGVSGLTYLHGYPVVIDLQHVQSSYPDFHAAATGGYDMDYRKTVAALIPYSKEIYAVRIDSEFNGNWAASTPRSIQLNLDRRLPALGAHSAHSAAECEDHLEPSNRPEQPIPILSGRRCRRPHGPRYILRSSLQ
jgi:hypothetical protein